ncbi:MAG: tyrosinase family protein [bacterium]
MGLRKNQAQLTAEEKARFVSAVRQLKTNGDYDRFVAWHRDAMNAPTMLAHRTAAFLPWHREFIHRFELALQEIDAGVTLPYWDWSVDRSPNSSLWQPDFMGGDGEAGSQRVTTGPFAFNRWTLTITSPGDPGPALRRTLGQAARLPTATEVNAALGRVPYDRAPWQGATGGFRNVLESVLHDPVHVWVGGSMARATSPNDPVFFLHHCNVDRLWALWQAQHPDQPAYLPLRGGLEGLNLNDPMLPWGGEATPASVINHRTLGYWYESDIVDSSIIDLIVGAPPTRASIGVAGEVDTYRFLVPSAGTHRIETVGTTDTVMSLLGPNNSSDLITEDDDGGEDRNARIVSRLTAGTYYVRVRHYDRRSNGNYQISVRLEAQQPTIPELVINQPAIQADIAAADESDLFTFAAPATDLYTIATSGNTDTFLTLFGPDSQTMLIAQNDDGGNGSNARIVADLVAGVYFVRVRHFDPNGTGPYRIAVTG